MGTVACLPRLNIQPDHFLVIMSAGGRIFHPKTENSQMNIHVSFFENKYPARGGIYK